MIAQSESLTDKFNNICRLCLKEENPMLSIFTTTTTATNCLDDEQCSVLAARITSIAKVQISPDDGLPAFICQTCRREVDKFYEFRLLVEISDRTLRSCFDGIRRTSEARKIGTGSPRVAGNVEYREYSVESQSPEDEKDLFSVNAILVPSASGMQVWEICSAEGAIVEGDRSRYEEPSETSIEVCPKIEYARAFENSGLDDFEAHFEAVDKEASKQTLGIKKIDENDTLYFATSTNSCERVSNDATDADAEECSNLEEYSCQLCLKSFQSLEALKNHVSDHFLGDNKRVAKDARKDPEIVCITNTDENATKDNRRVNDDDPEYLDSLACQSCDELFETMEERILHARRNIIVKGPRCRYCGKSFLKLSSRNYHEQSVHEQSLREQNLREQIARQAHKCDDCGKEFAKRSELRYHRGTHTSLSLTCTICNKHFRNGQSLKMHAKRHTLGSRYNCVECGKSYYTNSELARHVQQHTGTREYPCHLCDMSFLSKPELNRHFKYHNGEKKFECKLCPKTYYESGHLKVHERVHTGERPFSCTVCQKGFITKSKLVRHLKIHDRTRTIRRVDTNIS